MSHCGHHTALGESSFARRGCLAQPLRLILRLCSLTALNRLEESAELRICFEVQEVEWRGEQRGGRIVVVRCCLLLPLGFLLLGVELVLEQQWLERRRIVHRDRHLPAERFDFDGLSGRSHLFAQQQPQTNKKEKTASRRERKQRRPARKKEQQKKTKQTARELRAASGGPGSGSSRLIAASGEWIKWSGERRDGERGRQRGGRGITDSRLSRGRAGR